MTKLTVKDLFEKKGKVKLTELYVCQCEYIVFIYRAVIVCIRTLVRVHLFV